MSSQLERILLVSFCSGFIAAGKEGLFVLLAVVNASTGTVINDSKEFDENLCSHS